ncbi:uncharacterized protein LOC144139884 [Haemaphysalis longicornis]
MVMTPVTRAEARGLTEATESADTAPHGARPYVMQLYRRHKPFEELPNPSLDDAEKAVLALEAAANDAGEIFRSTHSPSTEAAVNKMATREAILLLYLTEGSSPTLLGRNRIQALGARLPEYQEAVRVVEDVPSLLTMFNALFQPGVGTFTGTAARIHVLEIARPGFSWRALLFALKDGVTQGLRGLQRDDIVVPVKLLEWAAPIRLGYRQHGSITICGDFKITINPGQRFTTLDLRDAYKQLVLLVVIPEREKDNLFRGVRHVAVYLDDILAGLDPVPRKVEAVLKASKPQNKKELQSFLGLINFYRSFLQNLSSHLQPLYLLLRNGEQWAWKQTQDVAFQCSKELITKVPVLVHFDPAELVLLTADASPYGVGAPLV